MKGKTYSCLNLMSILAAPAVMMFILFVAVTGTAWILRGIGLPRLIMISYVGCTAYAVGAGKIFKLFASCKETKKITSTERTASTAENAEAAVPAGE